MGTIALTAERPSARHRAGASLVAIGPARPATTGRPDSWQRHSEAGAAVRAEAVVPRPGPARPGCGRLRRRPELAGRPTPSKHNHVLRGMDRIEGGRDFDHRAVAWAGLAVISSLPARSLLPIVRCTSADLGRPGLRNPPAKRQSRHGCSDTRRDSRAAGLGDDGLCGEAIQRATGNTARSRCVATDLVYACTRPSVIGAATPQRGRSRDRSCMARPIRPQRRC